MNKYHKLSLLVLPLLATLSIQANDPSNDAFFKDPFGDDISKEMMQMQQNMDKMFDKMHQRMQQRSSKLVSPLNTYKIVQSSQFIDKGTSYEFKTNIPQNKENQIDITAKDGSISIVAKIIEKNENKTANAYSSSSSMRMYQQSVPLPPDVDQGNLKAEYKDGKLVIIVEKKKVNSKKKNTKKKESNRTEESNSSKKNVTINSDLPSMS